MATYEPSEDEWNIYGMMFAASRFGSRVGRVALWGIQLFMTLYGVSTFLGISVDLALDTRQVFRNLFQGGPDGRSYVAAYRKDLEDLSLRYPLIIKVAMTDATIIAGDILLLWRCSIVWKNRRWILILPALACAGSVVYMTMISSRKNMTNVEEPTAETAMTSAALSVAMNVMATGLILFKLATTWSAVSKACPNRKRSRMYSDVAAIIIESAAPLAVFGICDITATAVPYYQMPEKLLERGTIQALGEVTTSLYYSFSALSPQMIIFRVMTGRSWKDDREGNEIAATFSQPLRFAATESISTDDV
ncbi:hypothetical protein BKA70DRAFT_1535662 [Coprinopsis sp. MPI-PUGE-AT-0042]|nr:hypothetical protein BKA70DRAFT_1535662 [Coprinopsis sp. MPI-PUGE-AT-0042]